MAKKIFIGTSGWNYGHWSRDKFYPSSCTQREWLAFYARSFPTVEINNSFYRLPAPETFASWARQVPKGFVFAVKGSRFITHMKKLKDPAQSVKLFLTHSARLREKLGPVLFQLPPQMAVNPPRLRDFARTLKRRKRLLIAIEFRHPSWFTEEIYEIIDGAGWTICLADSFDLPREIPVLGEFCYVRRHGTTARYASCYSDEQLRSDAEFATRTAQQGRDVYVYFNNDAQAHAIGNALTLRKMIEPAYVYHSGETPTAA
ncbi:MAG TPA: DUF72 domain-containing protein [Candidatus Binatia bacterium]|jgi:uncharacterized protein YecE (DUF72 family)